MLKEIIAFGKTLIELVQKTRQQDEKLKQFDDRLSALNVRVDSLTLAVRELAYQLQRDQENSARDREILKHQVENALLHFERCLPPGSRSEEPPRQS